MSAKRKAGPCPQWCDDHIEDGYHQSTERRAGVHGVLLCQDDLDSTKTGVFFVEEFGGILPNEPFDREGALWCLDDLKEAVLGLQEAVLAKQRAVNAWERAIQEVWG